MLQYYHMSNNIQIYFEKKAHISYSMDNIILEMELILIEQVR